MGAVIIATRYVPRPPDDNVWNFWATNRFLGIGTIRMPVGGGFPFKPNWQRRQLLHYNDQGNTWNWWAPPRSQESVIRLVGGGFPFKPNWQRQQFFYRDDHVWN